MRIAVLLFTCLVSSGSMCLGQQLASGVYSWNDKSAKTTKTTIEGGMLNGNETRDLQYLEVVSTTLQTGKALHAGKPHNDYEELLIVKDGNLDVTINDKTKSLGRGSVILVIPGEKHKLENKSGTPVTFYHMKYRSKEPMDLERAKKAGGSFMIDWNDLVFVSHGKGGRKEVFERGTAMFKRFEMHVTTMNPGQNSHDPHTHRAEEFVLMMTGDVTMQIANDHLPASSKSGDLIFLASEVLHALTNTGSVPSEYFAFQWQ